MRRGSEGPRVRPGDETAGHRCALHGSGGVREVAQAERRPQSQTGERSRPAETLKLSREGWTGLAALAASLVLFTLTLDLKPNPLVPIGPGFYPRIVLGLSAVLAAALIAFDLFRP